MIKKLYDFRQTDIPVALLQAEVTQEDMDAELRNAAARFTTIAGTDGPIQHGDVVTLSFADSKAPDGVRQIYANVGKDFADVETLLPGLCVGDAVNTVYAGKEVTATIVCVKRLFVPVLTDAHAAQLGIEHVSTLEELEDHTFRKLAEGQRKRKFRGIMGIVSKAMMEGTEFEPMEPTHPWFQALHSQMMERVAAFAAREGKSVDEALPMALRMSDKPLEECRDALNAMCIERARQGALGQAYAQEKGISLETENVSTADMIGEYVDLLNQVVYEHFAPMIEVQHP